MRDLHSIDNRLGQSGILADLTYNLSPGSIINTANSKTGHKKGKPTLNVGIFAAIDAIAWKAYDSYSKRNQPTRVEDLSSVTHYSDSRYKHPYQDIPQYRFDNVANDQKGNAGQRLLLRAMIASAYVDRRTDITANIKVFIEVNGLNFNPFEKSMMFTERHNPLRLEEISQMVTNPETAIEVYTASSLVIVEDSSSSTAYLNKLRLSLTIPKELTGLINSEINDFTLVNNTSVA